MVSKFLKPGTDERQDGWRFLKSAVVPCLTKDKFETLATKEHIPGATSHVIRDFLADGIRFGKFPYEHKKLTIAPPKDKNAAIETEVILEPDAE